MLSVVGSASGLGGEWVGRRLRLPNFEMAAAGNLEEHRPALTGHCYRMLGSAADAEDVVQETMLRVRSSVDTTRGTLCRTRRTNDVR